MKQPHLLTPCLTRLFYLPLALLFATLCTAIVHAHHPGESYIFISIEEAGISGRVEFPEQLMKTARGENFTTDDLAAYTNQVLSIHSSGTPLQYRITQTDQAEFDGILYHRAYFALGSTVSPDSLEIDFRPFDDPVASSSALAVIERNYRDPSSIRPTSAENTVLTLSPESPRQTLAIPKRPLLGQLYKFARKGIYHIWVGADHILFLVALLLPAVLMRRDDGSWTAAPDFKTALWNLVKLVTAFTLAHSVTLALAQFKIVNPPSRLVETLIALSISGAALLLLIPGIRSKGVWLAFGFGLFHGFGFASLIERFVTGFRSGITVLGGFNIGVEIGQLAIVAVVFPILFLIRETAVYRRFLMPVTAVALIGIGLLWALDRSIPAFRPFIKSLIS